MFAAAGDIAELGEHAEVGLRLSPGRRRRRDRLPKLLQLVVEIVERRLGVRIVEANRGSAAGGSARRSAGSVSGTWWKIPIAVLLLGLLVSSQRALTSPGVSAVTSPKTCGWRRTSFAEVTGDGRKVAGAALLQEERQEDDLEEQVLGGELGVVAGQAASATS